VADYPFGIRLWQRVDGRTLIMFNARNDHDRSKFCEDLREAILEMDEMESLRIEAELDKQRMSSSRMSRVPKSPTASTSTAAAAAAAASAAAAAASAAAASAAASAAKDPAAAVAAAAVAGSAAGAAGATVVTPSSAEQMNGRDKADNRDSGVVDMDHSGSVSFDLFSCRVISGCVASLCRFGSQRCNVYTIKWSAVYLIYIKY